MDNNDPEDCRHWNEDWQPGDVAECVADSDEWGELQPDAPPIPKGARLTVTGVQDAVNRANQRAYFLWFRTKRGGYACQKFKKVRPEDMIFPEVVRKLMHAKPGPDKIRELAK